MDRPEYQAKVASLPLLPPPSGGRDAHPPASGCDPGRVLPPTDWLLCDGFPRVRQALGTSAWRTLLHAFRSGDGPAPWPSTETSAAFVAFLLRREGSGIDPPWLPELAHLEHATWLLARADAPLAGYRANGDLLQGIPMLSAVVPLAYRWPVDMAELHSLPIAVPAKATLLLARRGARRRVHVAGISCFEYALLVSLSANRWPGREHLVELARRSRDDPARLLMLGRALLEQLRRDGIVLGTLVDPRFGIDRHLGAMAAAIGN